MPPSRLMVSTDQCSPLGCFIPSGIMEASMVANAAPGASGRVAVLDLYRAVAILAVMVSHYTVRWTVPRESVNYYPYGDVAAWKPFELGGVGVSLFFMVSGFVILMTLERSSGIVDFALKRFARLWPPMLFSSAVTAITINLWGPAAWWVELPEYVSSILFTPPALIGSALGRPDWDWVDGAYWSLFVEVRFYILAAAVYLLCRRRFLTAWAVVQAISTVANLTLNSAGARMAADTLLLLNFMPYFTMGIVTYAFYAGHLTRERYLMALGSAAVLAVVTEAHRHGWTSHEAAMLSCAAIVVAALTLLMAFDNRVVSMMAIRPLTRLGEASYSLYLLHQLTGVILMQGLAKIGVPAALTPFVAAAAMIASAVAVFRWIEKPGRGLVLNVAKPLTGALGVRLRMLQFRPAT